MSCPNELEGRWRITVDPPSSGSLCLTINAAHKLSELRDGCTVSWQIFGSTTTLENGTLHIVANVIKPPPDNHNLILQFDGSRLDNGYAGLLFFDTFAGGATARRTD